MISINPVLFKQARRRRRLSQEALAEASGVSIATIKRIESGERRRTFHVVSAQRLVRALGVSISDIEDDQIETRFAIDGDVEVVLTRATTYEQVEADTKDHVKRLARLIWKRRP